MAKDSFLNSTRTITMARAQQHAEAEKHMAEVRQLTDQKLLQTYIRNGLLIIVVLLAVSGLLFIRGQKLQHARKQERIESEKYRVETELANAVMQLQNFTQSIHDKNELIEKITAEMEHIKALPGSINDTERNEILLQLQEATILTEDEWKNFKTLFEKVHGGFLNRIKEKFPELSPADIRFMALNKLNLTNKEMAGILGISPDAVRMNKHRLLKKLGLETLKMEELV